MARTKILNKTINKSMNPSRSEVTADSIEVADVAETAQAQLDEEDNTVSLTVNGHSFTLREPMALDFTAMEDWARKQIDKSGDVPDGSRMTMKLVQLCVIECDGESSADGMTPAVSFKDLFFMLPKYEHLEVMATAIDLFPGAVSDYLKYRSSKGAS